METVSWRTSRSRDEKSRWRSAPGEHVSPPPTAANRRRGNAAKTSSQTRQRQEAEIIASLSPPSAGVWFKRRNGSPHERTREPGGGEEGGGLFLQSCFSSEQKRFIVNRRDISVSVAKNLIDPPNSHDGVQGLGGRLPSPPHHMITPSQEHADTKRRFILKALPPQRLLVKGAGLLQSGRDNQRPDWSEAPFV